MQNSLGNFRAALMSSVRSSKGDETLGIGDEMSQDADGSLERVKAEMGSGAVYRYFLRSVVARRVCMKISHEIHQELNQNR